MPTTPLVETDTENLSHFRLLANKASSNAVRFRIVERFLGEVSRWLLKPAGPLFNVDRIKESIHALKNATAEASPALLFEAEFQLQREFNLWGQTIGEKDKDIETYNFRRFCDSSAAPLEKEIFEALASFYRDRPYSHNSQSKFDLVITRLFTEVDNKGYRSLRLNARTLVHEVERVLGDASFQIVEPNRFLDNAGAVAAIHSFIAEAQGLDNFDSLVNSRLFDRYREFKQELRGQFFESSVIAAAVQCNVVFANAFREMLESANENLSESLSAEIDIPSALHDSSPAAQAHLSDTLREFFDLGPDTGIKGGSIETDHIWDLLSQAVEKRSSAHEQSNLLIEKAGPRFDVTRSARDRLMPFLETLTKPEPDAGLLLSQLSRTKSLQHLNLSDFLYCEDHSADKQSRRILGLILWTEEFLQNELGQSETLTPTAQHEALSLIQKSEEITGALRADINQADEQSRSRLLTVQNALLESRLRLEGAIVRFTNKNLTPAPRREKTQRSVTDHAMDRRHGRHSTSSMRWLLWFFLIAALIAAAYYYFYVGDDQSSFSVAGRIEHIDLDRLPEHEFISNAYGRGNTMFVTARDSWIKLSTERQKAVLKRILEDQGPSHYETVILRDSAGNPLGDISPYGVHVPDQGNTGANKKSN